MISFKTSASQGEKHSTLLKKKKRPLTRILKTFHKKGKMAGEGKVKILSPGFSPFHSALKVMLHGMIRNDDF